MSLPPHGFWQDLAPAGTWDATEGRDAEGHEELFPATLPDGRQIALPIRVLPGDGQEAVASLILNQASFAVQAAVADALAARLAPFAPEVIVGVPTLGLGLAGDVARRLGHARIVPLGTSRKFWYRDELSVPVSSITSPETGKRLFLDPRMLPLLEGRRIAVVDDVASTGKTLAAVLALFERAGQRPVALGFAMLQGNRWQAAVPDTPAPAVIAAFETPRLRRGADGLWHPDTA